MMTEHSIVLLSCYLIFKYFFWFQIKVCSIYDSLCSWLYWVMAYNS